MKHFIEKHRSFWSQKSRLLLTAYSRLLGGYSPRIIAYFLTVCGKIRLSNKKQALKKMRYFLRGEYIMVQGGETPLLYPILLRCKSFFDSSFGDGANPLECRVFSGNFAGKEELLE